MAQGHRPPDFRDLPDPRCRCFPPVSYTHLLALDGREYLWQADPTFWGKHAPVLFPIVGSLRGDCLLYTSLEDRERRAGK